MPKWGKMIIALLLLPLCLGALPALWRVAKAAGGADTVWMPLLAGAGCWLIIFLLLPKPMWLYVVGHELTHALWTWLFLGRVKRFKATAKGGHVVVTRNNFLITLAPYFFPFYAVAVIAVFMAGHCLWDGSRLRAWFHLLLGAAYAFHLTLTWEVIQTRQPDITSQGYLFSGVIIFLGNIAVLLIGLPLLTNVEVLTALGWWLRETGDILLRLRRWL